MFWLNSEDVLFKWLAEEEPASLADVEIAVVLADEDGAELLDCNVLELTGTYWLRPAVRLWDAGSDLLECDGPLTVPDKEAFTDYTLIVNTPDEGGHNIVCFNKLQQPVVARSSKQNWLTHTKKINNSLIDQELFWLTCPSYICNCTNYILQSLFASRGNTVIWFPLNHGWLLNDSSTAP